MAEEFVRALARGLRVITAFDAEHVSLRLSEVAGRAELDRATARRSLLTLVELGYVRTDGTRFALTPQVLRLGTSYLAGLGLVQVAQPHLERLSGATGESTSAAVLDGAEVVYVARVATRRIMAVAITVGTRFPACSTSLGRVLLAARPEQERDAVLDEALAAAPPVPRTEHTLLDVDAVRAEVGRVREQGWALVDQELEVGLRSLAVPVRSPTGEVLAALNLSSTSPADVLRGHLDALLDARDAVEADLRLVPG